MLIAAEPGGPTPADLASGAEPPIGGARHRAAVLGSPIAHSLSPVLHRAAYAALGLDDWSYDRFAVGGPGEPDLASFIADLGPEWVGLSLTMPLKEAGLAVASDITQTARAVGATNTLLRRDGHWLAGSTDALGLLLALREAGVTRVRSVLILGSGATARSAVLAVHELQCDQVTFAVRSGVRSATRALAVAHGMAVDQCGLEEIGLVLAQRGGGGRDGAAQAGGVDVVVSTLPTGVTPHLPDLPAAALNGVCLLDVVYADWPTALADWGRRHGAQVISGLEMLVHQAAEQVRVMTGQQAPVAAMRAALRAAGAGDALTSTD